MRTTVRQPLPSRIPSPNVLNSLSLAIHCKGSCLTKPKSHHTVLAHLTLRRASGSSPTDSTKQGTLGRPPVQTVQQQRQARLRVLHPPNLQLGARNAPLLKREPFPTSDPARATRERVWAAIRRLRSCTCERGSLTDRLSECQAFEHSAPAVKLRF